MCVARTRLAYGRGAIDGLAGDRLASRALYNYGYTENGT
jgi:hypothetical protein